MKSIYYSEAANEACQLYKELVAAKECFLNSPKPIDKEYLQFTKSFHKALEKARPKLAIYSPWKQVFTDLINIVTPKNTLDKANCSKWNPRVFQSQTAPARILDGNNVPEQRASI